MKIAFIFGPNFDHHCNHIWSSLFSRLQSYFTRYGPSILPGGRLPVLFTGIMVQFRLLRGQSRSSAIKKFLESARQLTNYGIEIHTLSIRDRPYEIAVDCSGISINKRPKLKWASISEFRYRENKFTLVTKNANSEKVHTFTAQSTQKGIFFANRKKHLWLLPMIIRL